MAAIQPSQVAAQHFICQEGKAIGGSLQVAAIRPAAERALRSNAADTARLLQDCSRVVEPLLVTPSTDDCSQAATDLVPADSDLMINPEQE
jgi:hypothetical protein